MVGPFEQARPGEEGEAHASVDGPASVVQPAWNGIGADDAVVSEPQRAPPRSRPILAVAVVVLGSGLGIVGAVLQEFSADVLALFFAGPMIEEAMKPAGLYVLLVWRPWELGGPGKRAFLGGLAGLYFGLVESWVYVNWYVEDPTPDYIIFRYTVPVLLHTVTSAIFSLGITPRLMASVRGEVPFLSGSWRFFVAAFALHSVYNITVTALELFTGALSF